MPVQMQPAQIDFGALSGIGENIGSGLRKRSLQNAMQGAVGPDGTVDYNKAISVLMQQDPVLGLKLATEYEATKNMNNYRWAQFNQPPSGFQTAPAGGLQPIPGGPEDPEYLKTRGDRQNAPPGYRFSNPEDPNSSLEVIPGGPGEKVESETAARLGLAKSFLGEAPSIRQRIEAGELDGPANRAKGAAGIGSPAELRRKIDSGADALLRALTGAGMNMSEASEYVRRYRFSATDTRETTLSKFDQLTRELESVGETVGKGRGGFNVIPGAAPTPRSVQTIDVGPTAVEASAAVDPLQEAGSKAQQAHQAGASSQEIYQALVADGFPPQEALSIVQGLGN